MTFFKVWLKYYKFLSIHYAPYFNEVVRKYHSCTFIKILSLEFEDAVASEIKVTDFTRPTSIPFMYLNSRSLFNKMSLLLNYISEVQPKVVAITETWAKQETPDGIYALAGYNLFRGDRLDRKGGGVMIYIDASITASQISLGYFSDFEFVCCKLHLAKNEILGIVCVCLLYTSPSPRDGLLSRMPSSA